MLAVACTDDLPASPSPGDLPLPANIRVVGFDGSCGSGGCTAGITKVYVSDSLSRELDELAAEFDDTLMSAGWTRDGASTLANHSWLSPDGRLRAELWNASEVTLRLPGRERWVEDREDEEIAVGVTLIVLAVCVLPLAGVGLILAVHARRRRRPAGPAV